MRRVRIERIITHEHETCPPLVVYEYALVHMKIKMRVIIYTHEHTHKLVENLAKQTENGMEWNGEEGERPWLIWWAVSGTSTESCSLL